MRDESLIAFRVLGGARTRGTMVDVGAHFGGSLAPFARSGWQVFAFEPDAENRKRLADRFGALSNVRIDPRAISDSSRQGVTLFRSDQSTGISTLSPFHPSHVAGETIEVTTLERVCHEHHLLDIDYLKIDTEGFDLPVLKGLPWASIRPRLILCEFEDSKTVPIGYDFRGLMGFLEDKGYKLIVSEWFPVERYGSRHKWRRFSRYPCDLEDPKAWGNVFAVRDDRLYRPLLRACGLAAAS